MNTQKINNDTIRRLERISSALSKVAVQVGASNSDLDALDRLDTVDNLCTEIAEQAARVAGEVRERKGYRKGSAARLTKRVRKALGYAYP